MLLSCSAAFGTQRNVSKYCLTPLPPLHPPTLIIPIDFSQMELVPGEAVREELGAVLLMQVRDVGLKWLVQLPPHCAHSCRKTLLFFQLVALRGMRNKKTRNVEKVRHQ